MINAIHEVSWHSAESITRSIQMQIVDALRLGERSKASNQLLNLGRGNDLLRADDFVYILNYRAKSPDPLGRGLRPLVKWVGERPAEGVWHLGIVSSFGMGEGVVALVLVALMLGLLDLGSVSSFGMGEGVVALVLVALMLDQCTTFGLGVGEENVGMDMLDIHISQPVTKILRWSFSDVIHPCARLRNGGLAEELILQLRIMQQRNLKLYDSTLANLSVGCSKVLELDFSCVSAGSNI
ncbi:Hypothetical predicted protein [Prunus dulcis]|uniref:Uncharacterized protein n=1 Tax=Prunus dulcis TaxID=3755 RepID=A0A5E4G3U8_PRUDU|nr:Hypothetical predicted protein [Prunus dulcis]